MATKVKTKYRTSKRSDSSESKGPPPSYPWYPKDFITSSDFPKFTLAERGLYRDLLDRQWIDGSIPSDVEEIAVLLQANLADVRKAFVNVRKKFVRCTKNTRRMHNERLDSVRRAREKFLENAASAGKLHGKAQGQINGITELARVGSTDDTGSVKRSEELSDKIVSDKIRVDKEAAASSPPTTKPPTPAQTSTAVTFDGFREKCERLGVKCSAEEWRDARKINWPDLDVEGKMACDSWLKAVENSGDRLEGYLPKNILSKRYWERGTYTPKGRKPLKDIDYPDWSNGDPQEVRRG